MHTIKIGELARHADVHIETLRFYERKGLLSAAKRTEKGYRLYERDDITRVRFIKHAQGVGFSLKEVMELLQLKLDRKSKCADVEMRAKHKIEEINQKIQSLEKMRIVLESLAKACKGTVPLSECPILKAFEEPSSGRTV
ncbi:MAG TPA: MerR family transcriptional regulator [Acidobacteriota bacterium]|nr:MerR family transcriptional regulator [Acidobacteriota bacterium]